MILEAFYFAVKELQPSTMSKHSPKSARSYTEIALGLIPRPPQLFVHRLPHPLTLSYHLHTILICTAYDNIRRLKSRNPV